jgi:hypothetical protein
VVDEFGVKYTEKMDAKHLINALRELACSVKREEEEKVNNSKERDRGGGGARDTARA